MSHGTIGLTEDHRDLRDSVRALAQRHITPEVVRAAVDAPAAELPPFWGELAEQGLLALHLPEDLGGAGYGLLEIAVALEELGRSIAPGPYLPTVLASTVLHRAGHHEHLAGLADGSLVGTVALESGSLSGTRDAQGAITFSGTSGPALCGMLADVLVLPVRVGEERVWVALTRDQVQVEDPSALDLTRRLSKVTVAETTVPALAIEQQLPLDLAATLFAAEASGIADWATWTAAEYARVREQFGRKIGQFQGVKHRVAWMLASSENARVCAWDAARAHEVDGVEDPREASLAAAVAAAVSVQAAFSDAKDCVQTLGGIGFTWEHDASLYLRRAHSLRLLLGSTATWQQRVAELTLAGVRRKLALELPPEAEQVRAKVRAELAPAQQLSGKEQAAYLAEHGYTSPHLPAPWGKGADAIAQLVIAEELKAANVRPHDMIIGNWVVPTLIEHGSQEQLEQLLPASLRGDIVWCQLFSEPGAGSDLAGLSTKAEKVEGGWKINGQKVWTSGALESDFGILLARTDNTVAKHKGISYFVLDMKAPGIDIRPLRELTGEHLFNEVFFDDVFIPDAMLVAQPGDGWKLARTTLANERVSLSNSSSLGSSVSPPSAPSRWTPSGWRSSAGSSPMPSPVGCSACAA